MTNIEIEYLPYGGETPENRHVFQRYLADVQRGKGLLQLQATAAEVTPEIRRAWSPRSFTRVQTTAGIFDEVICNISYHFHKHGQRFGSIAKMTRAAQQLFRDGRVKAKVRKRDGLLQFEDGSLFETDGRIVTFVGS